MQPYILFYLGILRDTLGAAVICGLAVSLCHRLSIRMMGRIGHGVDIGTSVIGTPVHELGHALMCLLFGHKIEKMVLWQPRSQDGTLGYVTHAYNKKNPYHVLGNLFIGLGPIFSGLGVLILLMWLCFPGTLSSYVAAADEMVRTGESVFSILLEGLRLIPRMVTEAVEDASVPVWGRILGVLAMLSVSLHIELSPADIKGSLSAVPLYLVLVLLVTAVCAIIGEWAMTTVGDALLLFAALQVALFTLVLMAALLQVLVALPVWIIRRFVLR